MAKPVTTGESIADDDDDAYGDEVPLSYDGPVLDLDALEADSNDPKKGQIELD